MKLYMDLIISSKTNLTDTIPIIKFKKYIICEKFNHKCPQSLLLRIKKKHKFKCIQLIDKKITNRHLVLKVK